MTDITTDLARTLVADQFPHWADLPLRPVARQGWDNRTFRLGDDLTVRLPSGAAYVPAIAKEDRHLPALAQHLPIPIPEPVATGRPTDAYPHPWSIRRWLPGTPLIDAEDIDQHQFALDLAAILRTLRSVPVEGPAGGAHSFHRGCHPSAYADHVQNALRTLEGTIDTRACQAIWDQAMATVWARPGVWFHGDIAVGNLLTEGGRLSALIDFGTCGTGDPACDLQIAWTYFTGPARRAFRDAVGLDEDTWARARGWTLWKALIMVAGTPGPEADTQARILADVIADPID